MGALGICVQLKWIHFDSTKDMVFPCFKCFGDVQCNCRFTESHCSGNASFWLQLQQCLPIPFYTLLSFHGLESSYLEPDRVKAIAAHVSNLGRQVQYRLVSIKSTVYAFHISCKLSFYVRHNLQRVKCV